MPMMLALLSLVLSLPYRTFGANDWTKACLSGTCSFDIQEGPASMGGTIEISGSDHAISDITPAAGWLILNCSDNTNSQTIHLVCTDESSGCGHVFRNGAQDTIVRLPEDCGSGPFLRVANHSIADDQSIPADVASRLTRRGGSMPQVHSLIVDDNFEQITGRHGNVTFEIRAEGNLRHAIASDANLRKRQNGSGSSDEEFVIAQDFTFFNTSLTCPAANDTTQTQTLSASASFQGTAFNTTVIVTSTGTLSPPGIESLSFSAPTDGAIVLSSQFEAGLQVMGTLEFLQQFITQKLPSFSIDGIVTINPSFEAVASATASAKSESNFIASSSLFIDINELQFTFPSNSPPPSVDIPLSASFNLQAFPGENSTVQFTSSAIFVLIVEVAAFSQSTEIQVFHTYITDVLANPAIFTPSGQTCLMIANNFDIGVVSDGSFFQALPESTQQSLFSNATSAQNCQILTLEPSPPVARATRSFLLSRDSDDSEVSCPPLAALPQTSISLIS